MSHKTTLLIVDDSEYIRTEFQRTLEDLGYAVATAIDGADAMNVLRETKGVFAILSDLNMPNVDGMELLRQVKKDARLAHIHFFMLTASSAEGPRVEAKALGIRGWIVKMPNFSTIDAILRKLAAADGNTGGALR